MTLDELHRLFSKFGVTDMAARMESATGVSDLEQILKRAKKDARASYHRQAMDLHPDRNQDPRAEERFKAVSALYQKLQSIEIREPPPRQEIRIVVNFESGTSVTQTSTVGWW